MTAFTAPSVLETQFSGQYGNASVAHGTYNPATPQINDTVYLLKLYAGTKITGVDLLNGANGAATTLDLGFVNVDGTAGGVTTQFFAAAATSASARSRSLTRPITLTKDAYIVGTFKGAAGAAAGAGNYIDVLVEFEFRGA
jgi:hypothetical protein